MQIYSRARARTHTQTCSHTGIQFIHDEDGRARRCKNGSKGRKCNRIRIEWNVKFIVCVRANKRGTKRTQNGHAVVHCFLRGFHFIFIYHSRFGQSHDDLLSGCMYAKRCIGQTRTQLHVLNVILLL